MFLRTQGFLGVLEKSLLSRDYYFRSQSRALGLQGLNLCAGPHQGVAR